MEHFLLTAIILFIGSAIQGLAGFGFALTVMPILSLFMPVTELVPLVALCGTTMNLVLFFFLRRSFNIRYIVPLVIGALPGIPMGVLLLTRVDESTIKYLLAAILIAYSLFSLSGMLKQRGLSAPWGYFFGFLSGVLGGAINSNGPAIIVYASLKKWSPDEVKATLQSFFLASGIMIVTSHLAGGILTVAIAKKWLITLPMILAGIFCGMFLYSRINLVLFRRLVLFMLLILAAMLIFL